MWKGGGKGKGKDCWGCGQIGHLQRDCPKVKGKGKGFGYGVWGGTVNTLCALKIIDSKTNSEDFEIPNKKMTCRAHDKKESAVTISPKSFSAGCTTSKPVMYFRALESPDEDLTVLDESAKRRRPPMSSQLGG